MAYVEAVVVKEGTHARRLYSDAADMFRWLFALGEEYQRGERGEGRGEFSSRRREAPASSVLPSPRRLLAFRHQTGKHFPCIRGLTHSEIRPPPFTLQKPGTQCKPGWTAGGKGVCSLALFVSPMFERFLPTDFCSWLVALDLSHGLAFCFF